MTGALEGDIKRHWVAEESKAMGAYTYDAGFDAAAADLAVQAARIDAGKGLWGKIEIVDRATRLVDEAANKKFSWKSFGPLGSRAHTLRIVRPTAEDRALVRYAVSGW